MFILLLITIIADIGRQNSEFVHATHTFDREKKITKLLFTD